jgi:hypothetical protein
VVRDRHVQCGAMKKTCEFEVERFGVMRTEFEQRNANDFRALEGQVFDYLKK